MEKQRQYVPIYWIPNHLAEDPIKLAEIRPESPEWAKQDLHLFIVTDAGKPIYTRYGTIPTVSPIMCSWYAICSLMESLHEELDHFRAGSSSFVFLRKHSFIFIAVSKTAIPVSCLFKQLNYLYLLFLSLFSEAVLTQISQRPSIDFRLYSEPNRPTWNGVISNMSEDPAFIFVPSIPVLCVRPELRQLFSRSPTFSRLQSCKLSMLVKKNRVVAFGPHICDALSLRLIVDLIWTPVFRDEEHWVPLYFRDSNKTNMLFTHNLRGTDYYIVMLCGGNQEMDTYHSVSVSLINELLKATKNQDFVKPVVGAPDIFYCWVLNSLTYGQVFITDPDRRMFGETFARSNLARSSTTNRNPNLSQNRAPGQGTAANANQNANLNAGQNSNQNSNQNPNNAQENKQEQNNEQIPAQESQQEQSQEKIQDSNQVNDQISTQNTNQEINQTNDQIADQNVNQDSNQESKQDSPQSNEQISAQESNDQTSSQNNAQENKQENNDQISSQNSEQENKREAAPAPGNEGGQEAGQPSKVSSQDAGKRARSKTARIPGRKSPREKMRELYRQLAKSCDMVESNGVDGEYMFRGEKDIIVAYKNKEMELYAVARSEDLPDSMITKKLTELREFVAAHFNELIITDNKFYPEKFT